MWPIIAGMAIAAGSSITSGILGSMSATAQKKAIKKAAARSYNTMIDNSKEMERTLSDNMTDYERDAAEYRNTMYQRTAANGGIRGDTINRSALKEIAGYEFGIDEIDYEKYGYKKQDDVYTMRGALGAKYDEDATSYKQTKSNVKVDKKNTDVLKSALDDYTGRQATFNEGGDNTALDILRKSEQDLQTDLNRTYRQGMQQVYMQRAQAYNNYQDMKTQADLYGLQSTLSLFGGLLGAGNAVGQGMVSLYSQGAFNGSSSTTTTSAYNNPYTASSSVNRYTGHSRY